MTGLILAAGAGTRLNGSGVVRPKCLAPFGNRPLIEHQIGALRRSGIDDIVVVVGFAAERVRATCDARVRFVENTSFARTNSLYSLWLAREVLRDGFVVMNCDVLFHPQLLADLLSARHQDALLISYPSPDQPPFGDEEMKVKVRRGRVADIRKDLPVDDTDGENVGVVKFSASGAARLVPAMDRLVAGGGLRDWAPRAFREFAREQPLYAVSTRGLPWTEIDTPEDYQYAAQTVFPAIARNLGTMAVTDAYLPLAIRRGA